MQAGLRQSHSKVQENTDPPFSWWTKYLSAYRFSKLFDFCLDIIPFSPSLLIITIVPGVSDIWMANICFQACTRPDFLWIIHKNSTRFQGSHSWAMNFQTGQFQYCIHIPFSPTVLFMMQAVFLCHVVMFLRYLDIKQCKIPTFCEVIGYWDLCFIPFPARKE